MYTMVLCKHRHNKSPKGHFKSNKFVCFVSQVDGYSKKVNGALVSFRPFLFWRINAVNQALTLKFMLIEMSHMYVLYLCDYMYHIFLWMDNKMHGFLCILL